MDILAWIKDKARSSSALTIGAVLLAVVVLLNPAKLGVMLWLVSKLAVAAFAGYWADRILFPYARPHTLKSTDERNFRYLSRAVIVGCALIAAGLQA